MSWVYNGRDDLVSSSSVGLFFRDLPVALRLNAEMTLRDIFAEVHEQVQNGIKYSCYPYNEIEAPPVDDDDTCKKETMSEFQNLFNRVIATIVNANKMQKR